MDYRVYLLNDHGRIGAAESFRAPDDQAALDIARALFGACSDVFRCFELWQGTRRLATDQRDGGGLSLDAVVERHQGTVMDLEDNLQRGFDAVGRSRRLLALRSALSSHPAVLDSTVSERS